ncbi:hypothetical protein [Solicola gregarius]|uniref:Uncharacterized protein n=1 Tax=Solicola gregarius TaxID=2908642 RepID=A0AA46TGE5_9ACTN|nr:hypothetical protein [Solicola gregarius]UYM04713.1 hypothetical protein L0C25_19575 [Solicola gregarius]
MSVVLGDLAADTVDDARSSLCELCERPYGMCDGWQSLCPACCAVVDDHDAGRHASHPLASCQVCDDAEPRRAVA